MVLTITADGYVEEEFEFEVEENKNYSGEQFVISPAAGWSEPQRNE